MSEITSEELQTHTRESLDRVQSGETITVTIAGKPVATIQPTTKPRWISREEFLSLFADHRADSGLQLELAE